MTGLDRRYLPMWTFHALVALASFIIGLLVCAIAQAHDEWRPGMPVPSWVKASCCGPDDIHHLTPSQVHATAKGWRVDGYPDVLPYNTELPSEDGDYWIFYRTFADGSFSRVYCFFTPAQSF